MRDRTYVRRFNSQNEAVPGTVTHPLPTARVRTWSIQNGTTPTHAHPSKLSTSSPAGSNRAIASTAIGQCANSRSFHLCAMRHRPAGNAYGRCSTAFKTSIISA
ncbi:hypothetical protein RBB80_13860 [Tunturiibacter gelidiferens]